jgi:hypothetical protein
MADQADWTPGNVASMVSSPFYAVNIDEGLAFAGGGRGRTAGRSPRCSLCPGMADGSDPASAWNPPSDSDSHSADKTMFDLALVTTFKNQATRG